MVSGRLQGMKYVIYFYGCENHEKCKSIQFSSGYTNPFTADQANEWNKKYRWVKAFSGDGSNFKMDVMFRGGVTRSTCCGSSLRIVQARLRAYIVATPFLL